MSTVHPLPKEISARSIFTMLYGNDVEFNPGSPLSATADNSIVAIFVNDEDEPVSACICDYHFAAFAGAALTGIPRGGAEDAAETGEFSKMMLGNLNEIMNICSRLFMDGDSPHLRLGSVYGAEDTVPESALSMIGASQGQVDYSVTIPAYGSGGLSFLAT